MKIRLFSWSAFIITILTLTAVAYAGDNSYVELKNVLDSRVNNLTYDETLIGIGQPSTITRGDEIFIATWLYESTPEARPLTREDILGGSPESLIGLMPEHVQQIIDARAALRAEEMARERENAKLHGKSLQMTFNKNSRVMINWKYKDW